MPPFGPTSTHKSPPFWPWPFNGGGGGPTPVPDPELRLVGDVGMTLNAGNVVGWADQSGNGRDCAEDVGVVTPPAYQAAAINGVGGILCPPAGDPPKALKQSAGAALSGALPLTVFSVARVTSAVGGVHLMIGNGGGIAGAYGVMLDTNQYLSPYTFYTTPTVNYSGIAIATIITVDAAGNPRAWVNGIELAVTGTTGAPVGSGYTVGSMFFNIGGYSRSAGAAIVEVDEWATHFSGTDAAQQWAYAQAAYAL